MGSGKRRERVTDVGVLMLRESGLSIQQTIVWSPELKLLEYRREFNRGEML